MIGQRLQQTLQDYYDKNKPVEKTRAVDELSVQLSCTKKGKLYIAPHEEYAVRFSYSTKDSFANTVLALKNVLKYDHIPIILCLLKPNDFQLMLVNTTFLKKITHSSQALTESNIRGSFLGHDIVHDIIVDAGESVRNELQHFDELFALHQSIPTSDNVARLVAATSSISSQKAGLVISDGMRAGIHQSVAYSFTKERELQRIKVKLDKLVLDHHAQILRIAEEEAANVNLRGNAIEQLLTSNGLNQHGLADEIRLLADGGVVLIDIKTSTGSVTANAKLYNIDKQLQALCDGRTICAVYLIHIDSERQHIVTYMVNCFDEDILDHTLIQHHWSGRNSRGATQLHAKVFQALAAAGRQPRLNLQRALQFIDFLIARGTMPER